MSDEPTPGSPDFAAWIRATMTTQDFEALPDDDIEALRRFATREHHPAGAAMLRQGDHPQAIFIIESGEMELLHETEFGRLIVQILRRSSSVGDLSVMLETPYAYTAVARTSTTALRFDLETLSALMDVYPHICFRWLRLISRRLQQAQQRVVEISGRSATEQLVHLLLRESDDGRSPAVRLVQNDLAAALGLSRQTVSRVLRELQGQGLIRRGRGEVEVLDRERLRAYLPPMRSTGP